MRYTHPYRVLAGEVIWPGFKGDYEAKDEASYTNLTPTAKGGVAAI